MYWQEEKAKSMVENTNMFFSSWRLPVFSLSSLNNLNSQWYKLGFIQEEQTGLVDSPWFVFWWETAPTCTHTGMG